MAKVTSTCRNAAGDRNEVLAATRGSQQPVPRGRNSYLAEINDFIPTVVLIWPTIGHNQLMRCSLLILGLVLAGCASGQAEPATSPESVESEVEPAAVASQSDAPAAADAKASEGDEAAEGVGQKSPGGAPSPEDIRQVLQAVLDDEALQTHLKLEEPGRFPLQVARRNVPAGIELTKSTEPVKFVDAPKDKKDPVLVFTNVDIGPSSASVHYRYDVEGVRASCILKKAYGSWQLTKSRITQY